MIQPNQAHIAAYAHDAGEIAFEFDELFFSRTDRAGLIQFGNSVFTRISGYAWEDLVGKPHKIVRHPDTPRAVFHLLWSTIGEGQPIGAYVKNRAKDGRAYWVYAIVTPVDGGYLSVRLKPSSDVLAIVKREYDLLSARERSDRLTPADSAPLLMTRIGDLGFADYPTFMAAALGREIAARDAALGRPVDPAIPRFDELMGVAGSLITQANVVSEAYAANESVPFNFRVLAAQLGQDGSAIGVISSNYSMLSTEMRDILAKLTDGARTLFGAIVDGYFLACTARMQREAVEYFRAEAGAADHDAAAEIAMLDRQQAEYRTRASAALAQIARTAAGFQQACLEMNRLAAGLEVTRIMGKVECARHTAVKERTDELLHDLETFQKTIADALKSIERMNQHIRREADVLNADAA